MEMRQSIEEFLKQEERLILVAKDKQLFWNGSNWIVVLSSPPISLLYEGPLFSEALTCLRTGAPYRRKDEK